jgi:hypothetical protein
MIPDFERFGSDFLKQIYSFFSVCQGSNFMTLRGEALLPARAVAPEPNICAISAP